MKRVNKSLEFDPPHVHYPDYTTPVPSMTAINDSPIIYLGHELAYIISQDDSSHDNSHHDAPTIDLNELIGYTFVKGIQWTSPEGHWKG